MLGWRVVLQRFWNPFFDDCSDGMQKWNAEMMSCNAVASQRLKINSAGQPVQLSLLGTDDINLFDSLHASGGTD